MPDMNQSRLTVVLLVVSLTFVVLASACTKPLPEPESEGAKLYVQYCSECHGHRGEGVAKDHMPLIQGQHYRYLVRQFEWIRDGKRRNADPEMVKQIQAFTERDVSAVMDYTSRLRPPAERLASSDYRNPDFAKFWRPQIPPSAYEEAPD